MNEYISRKEAINVIKSLESSMPAAVREVSPAADVMPVKYGKWEETHISLCKWIPEDEKEEGHSFYMAELKCSCCKRYNAVTFVLTLDKPDFCQLCGARMDLDNVTHDRCSNYMDCDGSCFIDDTQCDCAGNIEKCKGR